MRNVNSSTPKPVARLIRRGEQPLTTVATPPVQTINLRVFVAAKLATRGTAEASAREQFAALFAPKQ